MIITSQIGWVEGARRGAGRALIGVAGLCVLIGVIGQFASLHAHLDVLNDLYPVWLAAGLAAAAGAAATTRRLWPLSVVMALCLLLIGFRMAKADLIGQPPARSAAVAGTIKVITFNVMKENVDPASTAAWIAAQNADVVVLEEAAEQGGLVADLLQRLYPFSTNCADDGYCSTIILSRRAPIHSEPLARGDPENRQGLSAVMATFASSTGPYTVVGVHLMRPWPMGEQNRELSELANDAAAWPKSRMIVAGDFNACPWSSALNILDVGLGLQRRTRLLATWPARLDSTRNVPLPFPFLAIDHLFAGRGWATVSVHRGPRLGSDHYPVVVELAPAPIERGEG